MSGSTMLAINGGEKAIGEAVAKKIPTWPPTYDGVPDILKEVYLSRRWSFNATYEQRFSKDFAQFHGAEHGVLMANGTVTLEAALASLDVRLGDEVIVPALTWIATAMAVIYVGGTPVFVDIESDTLCMNPTEVEKAITARTKAIIPVHLYGSMADMDAIMDIARRHGLPVVEDAAHAHGAKWDGRGAGSIGAVGSFSFQQSKGLTCGEGGICITNDADLAERLFRYKHIGYDPESAQRDAQTTPPPGLVCRNYRATEFQAAILHEGLKRLSNDTGTRLANAKLLSELIADIEGVSVQAPGRKADPQSYYNLGLVFDLAKFNNISLDRLMAILKAEGLWAYMTYGPVYGHMLWNIPEDRYRIPGGSCPATEKAHGTVLLVDLPWLLGDRELIEGAAAAIRKLAGYRKVLR